MSYGAIRTAHDLIDSIFSRPQEGVAGSMRNITPRQLVFLNNLIGKDDEGGAVTRGSGNSLVWMPRGPHKYVITEDPTGGDKHTLMRLPRLVTTGMDSLF